MIEYGLEYIWLISSDRDWDLLIQENVGRFSYVTRKFMLIVQKHLNFMKETKCSKV